MLLKDSQREKIILLVEQAISKVEKKEISDQPLIDELNEIVDIMSIEEEYSLPLRIPQEEMEYASEVISRMKVILDRYVNKLDVNDLAGLEEVKKELSVQLMYLSSYKDKFLYEIDLMEDVFKKEIFSKLTTEISTRDGISFTQAEKKVPADQRYIDLRRQVTEAKIYMMTVKTEYDFFSKMIQVIVQSISVAGKEQYSTRISN